MSRVKITVTIDKNLVEQLDRRSKERKKNRSRIVEEAIKNWNQEQLEQELIAGYRAMAREDRETAEANLSLAIETLNEQKNLS